MSSSGERPSLGSAVSFFSTGQACRVLGTAPNTLRSWDKRYCLSERLAKGHRRFIAKDIRELAMSLEQGETIEAAVISLRERVHKSYPGLISALERFDATGATDNLEIMRGRRPERYLIEEMVVPAHDHVAKQHGPQSVASLFATNWAEGVMASLYHTIPHDNFRHVLWVGNAVAPENEAARVRLSAFLLFCGRAGLDAFQIPVAIRDLSEAAILHAPARVVVAGADRPAAEVSRWIEAAQNATRLRVQDAYLAPEAPQSTGLNRLDPSPYVAAMAVAGTLD